MRGRQFAAAVAGLLLVGVGLMAVRAHLSPEPVSAVGDVSAERVQEPPRLPVEVARQDRIRPVASEIVALPQIAPEALERVAPREPLSRFSRPLPARPKNQGRIFRPLVLAAGQVSGSGLTVAIAGVEVTDPDTICTDAAGTAWPCGVRARSAFRAFVRGRALACDLPEDLPERNLTVACSIGRQDVGAWLVAQGWASAVPGGPYAEAGETARAAGKGIFGAAPVIEPFELSPVVEATVPVGIAAFPLE